MDVKHQALDALALALDKADAVCIGAGAGLSTAAGLTYAGKRFEKHFADFIAAYHLTDMYTAGFYPYPTPEEMWAYWSRHIWYNRYTEAPKDTYDKLRALVAGKDYFVITTNVDHCFQRAGFDKERLFYTQGDYGLWQCSTPCHDKTYDNYATVRRMVEEQRDMRVPTELVPRCPVCGEPMSMNLRADDTFVEDEGWHAAAQRYATWLGEHQDGHVLYLELGVGGNTPAIIKYPFWRFVHTTPSRCTLASTLARRSCHRRLTTARLQSTPISTRCWASCSCGRQGEETMTIASELTQDERRVWLIGRLLEEDPRFGDVAIPQDCEGQRELLRALMNVRDPRPTTDEFLAVQDAYLAERVRDRGVTRVEDIAPAGDDTRLRLWQGDITTLAAGAITNAANSQMLGCFVPGHHCIDNAIHTFAGIQLRLECARLMREQGTEEPSGSAKITPAYNLPCDYVVHTVGPIVYGPAPTARDEATLRSSYRSVLAAADEVGCGSVALCCVSTGVFHYPNDQAAKVAVDTVRAYLTETGTNMVVVFNTFLDVDQELYRALLR